MKPFHFDVLRALSHEDFRSGEAIARMLGVSRATVWNALRDIEAAGVEVFKVPGTGYRLAAPFDWLDRDRIRSAMGAADAPIAVDVIETVESTNAHLLSGRHRPEAAHCCVAAEWQTRGRGRRGRVWHAALGGGLAFSLRWRFQRAPAQLGGLSLAVGVGLSRALRELGVPQVELKWPNDLVHAYRKLGGVLIELQGDALGPTTAVIGVGLNFRVPPRVREAIDQAITDLGALMDDPPSRNVALARMLVHLQAVLSEFDALGFAPLRAEWEALHAYHGKAVLVRLRGGASETGVVRGVGQDGALLVESGRGVQRFDSAEISLRLAASVPQATERA